MAPNSYFFVSNGTTNAATSWFLQTSGTILIGSTLLVFQQFSASQAYTADNSSLQLSGNVFSTKPNGTLAAGMTITTPLITLSTSTKINNYVVLSANSGTYFDNGAAAGEVDFTLPAALPGLNYCFSVVTAQIVKIVAATGEKIAVGLYNSAASGNVVSNVPFSSLCIYAPSGMSAQWVTKYTPTGLWTINSYRY